MKGFLYNSSCFDVVVVVFYHCLLVKNYLQAYMPFIAMPIINADKSITHVI